LSRLLLLLSDRLSSFVPLAIVCSVVFLLVVEIEEAIIPGIMWEVFR